MSPLACVHNSHERVCPSCCSSILPSVCQNRGCGLLGRFPVKGERVYNQRFTLHQFVRGKAGWYVYAAMAMAACGLLFACLAMVG